MADKKLKDEMCACMEWVCRERGDAFSTPPTQRRALAAVVAFVSEKKVELWNDNEYNDR